MATISVVISAFNEENKIADCLESAKWADEIVFVDNSSTDKTPQIAKKHKVRFFERPNNPMLNVNKNFGFTKATGEWILYLDADERVTPELRAEILEKIGNWKLEIGNSHVNGYWIPRKNIIFGKWIEHTGFYPDYQMRLFKRSKGKFPALHVHEMIEVDGKTEHIEANLLHYNFETTTQFLYKHVELYAPNEAKMLLEKGYSFSPLDALSFPVNEFLSRYFAREGYKDGLHGLVLSLLLAFYHLTIFARIWEKQAFKEYNADDFLDQTSGELKKMGDQVSYWAANEKIKKSENVVEKYVLRVVRKVKSEHAK